MNTPCPTRILIKGTGSRIRLSSSVLTPLGWSSIQEDFECWGIFRQPGELLCAPKSLITSEGVHPFDNALEYQELTAGEVGELGDIPPAHVILAPSRIVSFGTSWLKPKRAQLDLKIGASVAKNLGWRKGDSTEVYTAAWGAILILLSKSRYLAALERDFTDGHLRSDR